MPSPLSASSPVASAESADWWRTAVVYQVYPRSFADSNGDGIGDLRGLHSRLPYLQRLGIDAIWLSPFYPSPLADGGYDIADYRDVDARLGTLDDFDEVVATAHGLGIHVIVDIVPNHTSDQHPWFQQALASAPGSPARERYIFRDGTGPGGSLPPSDWLSHFGGSAWQRAADGQWYCHLFAREQPDLNWDNPDVRDYFEGTLRFWADRGVDGFRIDVAHSLAKDISHPLRSQPLLDQALPLDGTDPLYDREEVHAIYETWRAVFDEYDPPRMAVAETWHPVSERTFLYARPTELGQVFDFSLLKSAWDETQLRAVIERSIANHAQIDAVPTWVLSSHDVPRHASRLALPNAAADADAWLLSAGTQPVIDPAAGLRRARAATLMMLALPGSAYLYQGEELGLPEVADLPLECLQDPTWERTGHSVKGRDGARVPLPWNPEGESYGFGKGRAWLPQPSTFAALSAASQEGDPASTLAMYRDALAIRRRLELGDRDLTWNDSPVGSLSFDRGHSLRCIVNVQADPIAVDPDRVLLSSSGARVSFIEPEMTVWSALV